MNQTELDDTVFIKLLEKGETAGLDGITYEEFTEWAKDFDFIENSGNPLKQKALSNLLNECFDERGPVSGYQAEKTWVLKNIYFLRLIGYRELKEARIASRQANKNAMWAIGISIAAIIVSAVLTFAQLNTPATINKSDLNALIKSNRETGVQREVKLDSLQMAQILSGIGYDQSNSRTKKQKVTDQGQEVSHHELINRYFEEE